MQSWDEWQQQLISLITHPASQPDASWSEAGLAVYRNNYRVGLLDTLKTIYPVLEQWVGTAFFEGLGRKYIQQYPSESGNLHDYGAALGGFIDGFEHTQALPYLGDIARLEWHVHCSYYAADTTPFDSSILATLPPERVNQLSLPISPATFMLRSAGPVATIWQAHQPQSGTNLPDSLDNHAENVLISRVDGHVEVNRLPDEQALFIAQLLRGATLEQAVDAVLATHPGFDLQATLIMLLQQQCLMAIDHS